MLELLIEGIIVGAFMRLKYQFMTTAVGDECYAVAVGNNSREFSGMIKLNEEGAEIINLLSVETEYDKLIDGLSQKYEETSREEIEMMVNSFLDSLRSEGLLVE